MIINRVLSSKVVNYFTTIYFVYYELIHIHKDKSGNCWHAHRFGSRWPPHCQDHAFIAYLRVPSPRRQGTNLNPALVEDAFTSAALGIAGPWRACWQVIAPNFSLEFAGFFPRDKIPENEGNIRYLSGKIW